MHYSFLSVMKINVWHSVEQRTIDASIDHGIHDSKYGIIVMIIIIKTIYNAHIVIG